MINFILSLKFTGPIITFAMEAGEDKPKKMLDNHVLEDHAWKVEPVKDLVADGGDEGAVVDIVGGPALVVRGHEERGRKHCTTIKEV